MSYTVTLTDDPYLAVLTPPPPSVPLADRARFALHYAMLAPSVHNTQPWLLKTQEADEHFLIDAYADFGRELPALDPHHRQLIISCGAMVGALRAGLLRLGLHPEVTLLPRPGVPRLLARIDVREPAAEQGTGSSAPGEQSGSDGSGSELGGLAEQLRARRSYRGPLDARQPAAAERQELAAAAAAEGVTLAWIDDPLDRRAFERMAIVAALVEAKAGGVDEEVRLWTSRDARALDGIPSANWQRTSMEAVGAPVVQRDFALGRRVPARKAAPQLGDQPGALAVLCTSGDGARDWLVTGQALLRVLLRAEAAGLAVGYVNHPTEIPDIRKSLAAQIAHLLPANQQTPQLVLRIGHAARPEPPPTPRRTVAHVLRK